MKFDDSVKHQIPFRAALTRLMLDRVTACPVSAKNRTPLNLLKSTLQVNIFVHLSLSFSYDTSFTLPIPASPDLYAAAPLDPHCQCLRLVELQPDHDTDTLRYTLRTCRLADRPSYTVLSYTWGSDAENQLIELNGVVTPIRDNLWSFLNRRRLRQEYGPLWVDAICINQANSFELNHQVPNDATDLPKCPISVGLARQRRR
jgi:hypothetical protein